MCLSVPAEIISIENQTAIVNVGGTTYKVGLSLIENAMIGEYVLIHSGYAISKIDPIEAEETLKLLDEMQTLALIETS